MKPVICSLTFFSLLIYGIYSQVKIIPRELKVGSCINGYSLPVIEDGIVYGYKRSTGVQFKIKEIKVNYYILTPIFNEWEKNPELATFDVYISKEDFKRGDFHEFGFMDNTLCILDKNEKL
jgi:hypothetical protein